MTCTIEETDAFGVVVVLIGAKGVLVLDPVATPENIGGQICYCSLSSFFLQKSNYEI